MQNEPLFDHEKLKVYQRSIEFVASIADLLDAPTGPRISAHDQLDRASTSVPLNIAEGNGKWTIPDRLKFFDTARASGFESAAALDVLVARRRATAESVIAPKRTIREVVAMLSTMVLQLHDRDRADPSPRARRPRRIEANVDPG